MYPILLAIVWLAYFFKSVQCPLQVINFNGMCGVAFWHISICIYLALLGAFFIISPLSFRLGKRPSSPESSSAMLLKLDRSAEVMFLTVSNCTKLSSSSRTTFLCVPFRHSTELHVHFACIFSPHNNTLSQELSGTNFYILLNSCHQILCDVVQKGCYAECRDSSDRWTNENDLSSSCHYKKDDNHKPMFELLALDVAFFKYVNIYFTQIILRGDLHWQKCL